MAADSREAGGLTVYDFGRTTAYACRMDQRFSYCLYVPSGYRVDATERYGLAVVVHGTERGMAAYRDRFADFAEANDCIVLAPLFPVGITAPYELSSYKLLRAGDLHYDAVLLSMVEEVAARYRLRSDRFLLYGFSGGGHFSHRFFYLHPERLQGVSIGAPGVVTLLDETRDFWVGLRDFEQRFGKPLDLEALRRVPVQMVIGAEDRETWEITITPDDPWWMEGADLAGANRQDRMRALKASFEAEGIAVRHDLVPGAGHDGSAVVEPVKAFFAAVLAGDQAGVEVVR
ncbi:MAG: hypothetical protein Kilf2KO_05710 [Rhodospirillales bacterium]